MEFSLSPEQKAAQAAARQFSEEETPSAIKRLTAPLPFKIEPV